VAVVELLEVVDVGQQQAHRRALLAGLHRGGADGDVELLAVGDAGEPSVRASRHATFRSLWRFATWSELARRLCSSRMTWESIDEVSAMMPIRTGPIIAAAPRAGPPGA
jgi:hypothetical protein